MIPKIIHYCWFGRKPLPENVLKYMESWRKYLPECEIKEWNEENFDVNKYEYTKQAYYAKKYAFVSDVARLYALVNEGGLYLDTDILVLKSLDSFFGRKMRLLALSRILMLARVLLRQELIILFLKIFFRCTCRNHFIID